MSMSDYLLHILRPLLRHPDSIRVVQTQDQMGVLLTVDVSREDMGIIIGKGGETAKAVRHLVRIAGINSDARVSIKINEPEGSGYKAKK